MDRQTNYEPRPEIARLKSFNGEKGIYSYHIKWAIGILPVNPVNDCICSGSFKTKDPERRQTTDDYLDWKLRFYIGEECDKPHIEICRIYDRKDEDDVMPIPVIARVKLVNETKGIIEFSSSAGFFISGCEDWYYDWNIPDEVLEKLSKTDRYAVHCWLDIPKNYNRRCTYTQNSGSALLSSSLRRSFDKITIKNADPTSDVELVIKDGSDEPPRFYCHRLILAARSPVFETMFTNDRFKESNERIVEIEDMDGKTLKLLLKYLYTGEITRKLFDAPKELI